MNADPVYTRKQQQDHYDERMEYMIEESEMIDRKDVLQVYGNQALKQYVKDSNYALDPQSMDEEDKEKKDQLFDDNVIGNALPINSTIELNHTLLAPFFKTDVQFAA